MSHGFAGMHDVDADCGHDTDETTCAGCYAAAVRDLDGHLAGMVKAESELEAERAKCRELAAALVQHQRDLVVMQQERDELEGACARIASERAREMVRALDLERERDSVRGEVLGLLRMLRERGVEL